jgi:hypothetical protein
VAAMYPTDAWDNPYLWSIIRLSNDLGTSELRVLLHSFGGSK